MSSLAQVPAVAGDKQKVHFFRSTLWNANVVGLTAFVAPGLYNAMTSTGAGGAQDPYLVLRATSVLSCMMILSCYVGSIVSNRVGLKWTLILGTTGYAMYSASLYQNIRYGTEWFVIFGAAVCGLSAGLFWASEAAIMVAYPEAHLRGRYLSLWLAYRNSGSILGGCINLAFNAKGKRTGKLDWRSYIVFVVLQCLGPAIGAFLTQPEKVERTDGTKVQVSRQLSDKEELKALAKLSFDRRVLLTIPIAFYAIFQLSWVGSFLTQYYSVRARALASLVAALAQILGNLIFGWFLDLRSLSLNKRAKWGFAGMMALHGGTWIWASIVQHDYASRAVKPAFDWSDPGFGRGWALYIFVQLCFSTIYNFLFWIIGGLATNANEVVRFTSIIRSWESAGGAVASGIASTKTPLIAQVGVNFGLWAFAIPFSWYLFRGVGLDENGNDIDFFDLNSVHDPQEPQEKTSPERSSPPSITDKDAEVAQEDEAAKQV
ncbi:hypothetical protein JCM10450v2_000886 [Rhodotorula kratochvilovae]